MFWRPASLPMSGAVALKKDGSEAVIWPPYAKIKMVTSHIIFIQGIYFCPVGTAADWSFTIIVAIDNVGADTATDATAAAMVTHGQAKGRGEQGWVAPGALC